jgi:hypothetical protein
MVKEKPDVFLAKGRLSTLMIIYLLTEKIRIVAVVYLIESISTSIIPLLPHNPVSMKECLMGRNKLVYGLVYLFNDDYH